MTTLHILAQRHIPQITHLPDDSDETLEAECTLWGNDSTLLIEQRNHPQHRRAASRLRPARMARPTPKRHLATHRRKQPPSRAASSPNRLHRLLAGRQRQLLRLRRERRKLGRAACRMQPRRQRRIIVQPNQPKLTPKAA